MKRLFLALWPDHKVRGELKQISGKLDLSKLKRVKPENIHITLIFIGSVENPMISIIIQRVLGISVKPFTVVFDELHFWRKPKVLCLTSSSPPSEIIQLAEALTHSISNCGLELDKRAYRPHVTLARKADKKPALDFTPVIWHADSFCLVESVTKPEGVCYQVVNSWSFYES